MTKVLEKFDALVVLLEDSKDELSSIIDEEQEAYDNLPESIQFSERGEQMEENISIMQEVYDSLSELDVNELHSNLSDVVSR